jgi:Mor family transcriptional regulator
VQNRNVKYLETIKEIIGADSFQALVAELPGAAIRIPSDPKYFDKQKRNDLIRKEYHAGSSISDLAIKYNLSRSQIYAITEEI